MTEELLANAYIKGASDLLQGNIEGMPKVVVIPYNATNGDMFTAVHPNVKIEKHETYSWEYRIRVDGISFCVSKSWWNAPYKKEVECKK